MQRGSAGRGGLLDRYGLECRGRPEYPRGSPPLVHGSARDEFEAALDDRLFGETMMKRTIGIALLLSLLGSSGFSDAASSGPAPYLVCVSNERSGDVTILDGADRKLLATVPVGKRPRGIHASPDGRFLYVALSGSPITGPPQLDAKGNPILREVDEDDVDHSADGIGVIDLVGRKFLRKLPAGSDPEEFAVNRDGTRIYISNEDVATASVLNVADGEVEQIVRVKKEPEGVALSPDGRFVYVTCETGGEVVVIDTRLNKGVAEFTVGGRPRTVAFLPDGSRAFIPSETTGTLHVVDTASYKTLSTITLPAGSRPMGTAMDAEGKRLYVSNGRAGTVCVVDPHTGRVLNTIAVGKRPWGLAIAPDGRHLYVANGPSNDVSVIDLGTEEEVGRVQVGDGPWGVAIVATPR
jgi:YVTN family beta-propeller protein